MDKNVTNDSLRLKKEAKEAILHAAAALPVKDRTITAAIRDSKYDVSPPTLQHWLAQDPIYRQQLIALMPWLDEESYKRHILRVLADIPPEKRSISTLVADKQIRISDKTLREWRDKDENFGKAINRLLAATTVLKNEKRVPQRESSTRKQQEVAIDVEKQSPQRQQPTMTDETVFTKKGPVDLQGLDLGQRISALRDGNSMKLRELGRDAGLALGYLSNIETSKRLPPLDTIYELSASLHVDYQLITNGYRYNVQKYGGKGLKERVERGPNNTKGGSATVGLLIGLGLLAGVIALSKRE